MALFDFWKRYRASKAQKRRAAELAAIRHEALRHVDFTHPLGDAPRGERRRVHDYGPGMNDMSVMPNFDPPSSEQPHGASHIHPHITESHGVTYTPDPTSTDAGSGSGDGTAT